MSPLAKCGQHRGPDHASEVEEHVEDEQITTAEARPAERGSLRARRSPAPEVCARSGGQRAWPDGELIVRHRAQSARAKSPAEKGRRSSMPSPTPMRRIGRPSSRTTATAMPPLAVPSSLVRIRPSSPRAALNSRACCRPFWPVVASITRTFLTGGLLRFSVTRTTFCSSRMRSCRRVQSAGGVDEREVGAGALGLRDGVEGDRGRVGSAVSAHDRARGRARPTRRAARMRRPGTCRHCREGRCALRRPPASRVCRPSWSCRCR